MPKTYYATNNTLNLWLRNTSVVTPVQVYCALFLVAPPTPGTPPTEVVGNGYARQVVTFGLPVNGQCSNLADVVFPLDIVTDWGTIVAFGIYDGAAGGNLLYYANLSSPRYVAVNDQLKFPVGQLVAQET
jgi:hypothetical protein